MAFPVSILLIAVGAVLAFAVNRSPNGVDIHTVGWILLAVGFVGLLLGLFWWESWGGGYWTRRRTYVARDRYPPPPPDAYGRRGTVIEEDVGGPVGPPGPPGPPPEAPPPP